MFAGILSAHQPLIRDYNLFVYHVWLHNLAPTPGQVFRGILLALALSVGLSLAVRALTNLLFGRFRPAQPAPVAPPA